MGLVSYPLIINNKSLVKMEDSKMVILISLINLVISSIIYAIAFYLLYWKNGIINPPPEFFGMYIFMIMCVPSNILYVFGIINSTEDVQKRL